MEEENQIPKYQIEDQMVNGNEASLLLDLKGVK